MTTRHQRAARRALWGLAALLLALCIIAATTRTADATPAADAPPSPPTGRPWPRRATARVARHAETILGAARAYDVDPALLAAVAVHETALRPLRGGAGDAMWGPAQVAWSVWGEELQVAGIALEPDDLIEPDLVAGLLAGAYVLSQIRAAYPGAEGWRVLCLYSCGVQALGFVESCAYSDAVLRHVGRARGALAAGVAVRARFGDMKKEGGR